MIFSLLLVRAEYYKSGSNGVGLLKMAIFLSAVSIQEWPETLNQVLERSGVGPLVTAWFAFLMSVIIVEFLCILGLWKVGKGLIEDKNKEIDRIVNERDKLQDKLFDGKLLSTNDPMYRRNSDDNEIKPASEIKATNVSKKKGRTKK